MTPAGRASYDEWARKEDITRRLRAMRDTMKLIGPCYGNIDEETLAGAERAVERLRQAEQGVADGQAE
jgi:hypothetical protein